MTLVRLATRLARPHATTCAMTRRSRSSTEHNSPYAADAPSRKRRVGVVIRGELVDIITNDINDPNVGVVTITGVDVSPDLKKATIYVNHLTGDAEQSNRSVVALNHAASFLRRKLARRMTQRVTPELVFKYDNSIETGARLSRLIDDAVEDASAADADSGQTDEATPQRD